MKPFTMEGEVGWYGSGRSISLVMTKGSYFEAKPTSAMYPNPTINAKVLNNPYPKCQGCVKPICTSWPSSWRRWREIEPSPIASNVRPSFVVKSSSPPRLSPTSLHPVRMIESFSYERGLTTFPAVHTADAALLIAQGAVSIRSVGVGTSSSCC